MSMRHTYQVPVGITLHHGDSLQLLPQLDGPYDALITDPPYSSGGRTAAERQASPKHKYVRSSAAGMAHNVDFAGDMMDARSWTNWCAAWLSMARQLIKEGGLCAGVCRLAAITRID